MKFTVDKFDDGIVHYLDIKTVDNETDIYFKDTHTGQYMQFASYASRRIKTTWVKALFQRAVKICSTEQLLNQQIKKISLFMSWNGFPNYISKALPHYLKSNVRNRDVINEINNNKENATEIFFCLPYAESKGEQLVKHCLKKIRHCLKINVKFVVIYDTKTISFYCNVKDKVPHEQRNNNIYRIMCPDCGGKYIAKTKRCPISRMNEHGTRDTEPMFKHLTE